VENAAKKQQEDAAAKCRGHRGSASATKEQWLQKTSPWEQGKEEGVGRGLGRGVEREVVGVGV